MVLNAVWGSIGNITDAETDQWSVLSRTTVAALLHDVFKTLLSYFRVVIVVVFGLFVCLSRIYAEV